MQSSYPPDDDSKITLPTTTDTTGAEVTYAASTLSSQTITATNSNSNHTHNYNSFGHNLSKAHTLTVPTDEAADRQYVVGEPIDLDRICSRDTTRTHRSCREHHGISKIKTTKDDEDENEKDIEKGGDMKEKIGSKTGSEGSCSDEGDDEEFLVDWDGPDDPKNPLNWSAGYRYFCLITMALQTLVVVFYSSSYVSGAVGMMRDFGIENKTIVVLGITTYLLGLAFAPLILAPLSEMYGRRRLYMICMAIFILLSIPLCLAKNITTIIAVRFLTACAGAVTLANGPGTLADIFKPEDRSTAFAVFAIAPMNGPSFGPLFGGILYQYLGWRSLNYTVLILATLTWLLNFLVPETYAPHLLRLKALQKRLSTNDPRYHSRYDFTATFWSLLFTNLTRPIHMLFTEAICACWAVYVAVIYAILYMSFVAYPIVFTELRGWEAKYSGLAFLGICAGTFLGIGLDPVVRWGYNRHKIDPETGKIPPEALIWSVCIAAVLSPMGLYIFAWTSDPRIVKPWIWSILAGIPFGTGNCLIFIHGSNYLLNSYSIYAASAAAGNTVARSILGGVLPLVAPKMYTALSPPIAGTILAALATVLIPIPWIFYKWGKQIRHRSPLLMALAKEQDGY
ncbi:hypothetical protein TWF225_009832 [Orbilia oligospora]|nr:hypothetical protein TWF225_009832 [Orbilia oligospora]KAF3245213.1 hypothetical protein TWF217_010547 [Orbilia oligospora]KAF3255602.1 hypothetical protein TWF128_005593 [Orbilia oligospora]KAF3255603.1 hypothetical protein TWF128_005593 [Orbilia oligospora]